jgi:hypothetical protein
MGGIAGKSANAPTTLHFLREAGICTTCLRRRTFGKATCRRCRARASTYGKRYRAEAKQAGVCVACKRPSKGRYHCQMCRGRKTADKRARIVKRMRAKQCIRCGREHGEQRQRCERCIRRARAYNRARAAQIRQRVLALYGDLCRCCRVNIRAFLTLDHIHDDGRRERMKIRTSQALYKRILDGKAPQNRYQLLCYNCNLAKAHYGRCPHTALRSVPAPVEVLGTRSAAAVQPRPA